VQIAMPAGEGEAPVGNAASPAVQLPHPADFARTFPLQPSSPEQRIAVRAALKAGVLGVFLGMIPILGIVLTGSLAVYFYRREKGIAPPTAIGARLGGAAGVVVSAVNALAALMVIALHAQQECIDGLTRVALKFGINTSTPEFQAGIRGLFTPSGLISSFIMTLVLAALGGVLAAAVFRPPSRS
jgi:hypothetical protein